MNARVQAFIPVLAAALIVPAAASRADVVDHLWIDEDNFQYRIVHMPDFDQRRTAEDGVPGLPNGGNMYCVPTAAANVLAYAANHGFPQVMPGTGNWQSQNRYNDATSFLALLGGLMGTDPNNGTGWNGWNFGMSIIVPPNTLTYTTYIAGGSYAPKFRSMAQAAMNGSLVQFCHGWYTQIGEVGGVPWIDRNGGHCLTMTRAYGALFTGDELFARDPADDAGNNTQSPFMERKYGVANRTVYVGALTQRTMSNLQPTPGEWSSRYLDGYAAIRPKAGYSFTDTGIIYFGPLKFWGQGTPDSVLIAAQNIVDLVVGPDQNNIYYESVDDGIYRLFCANLLERRAIPIDIGPVGIEPKILFGRRRQLYRQSGRTLSLIDPETTEVLVSRILPFTGDAVGYDDNKDEIIVIDAQGRQTALYPFHLDAEPVVTDLPGETQLPLGDKPSMSWDPFRGTWWVASDASDDVFQLTPNGNAYDVAKISHEALVRPTSVDVDDAGDVFAVSQGRLLQFKEQALADGSTWVLVEDGPFAGIDVGPVARVTKSRTNYDPAVHDGPEWNHVLPDSFGAAVPGCPSDLDFSGAVDFGDILAILSAWGPCPVDAFCSEDLSFSGAVDFADVLRVLADWGACP